MSAFSRVDQAMAAAAAGMLPERISRELRTRYRQLPVMIRTAGLAATYAFLLAKANGKDSTELSRAYRQVADGIRKHLASRKLLPDDRADLTNEKLLTWMGEANLADYTRAAAEVEALARWLSRLAEATYRLPEQDQKEA